MTEAKKVLDEVEIDYSSINMSLRQGFASRQAKPTVVIIARTIGTRHRWRSTLITLSQLFHTLHCRDLCAEIAEPKAYEVKRTFAIPANHPLIPLWNDEIVEYVQAALHNVDWKALEVFNYGPTIEDAEPSILITTPDLSRGDWDSARRKVVEICARYKFQAQVNVIQGNVWA